MNRLHALIVLALVFGLAGCARLPWQTQQGASTIAIAQSDQTPQTAFKTASKLLSSQGYTYAQDDERLRMLRTEWRSLPEGGPEVRFAVEVIGEEGGPTETHLWGWYRRSPDRVENIQETEQEGTEAHRSWMELRRLARELPGTLSYEVVYEK